MKDPGSLWRVEVAVPVARVDAFATALEDHCDSVSWTVPHDGDRATLIGFSRIRPTRKAVDLAFRGVAEAFGLKRPMVSIGRETPRDWVDEIQASFPPLDAGRFYVHGAHVEGPVPPGRIGLRVDAGRAFGSGQHGSTKGCLLGIDALVGRKRMRRALDMGCGSGILALAIARAMRLPVLACDIDPQSVEVTAVNAGLNHVAGLVRAARTDGYYARSVSGGGPFDLIVSNILARPLIRMAGDLARHLAPAGVAVLSGFVPRDAGRVRAAHAAHGLRYLGRLDVDGWTTLILVK